MEGVTVVSSFMFGFEHVNTLLILTCISLALTYVFKDFKDYSYCMVAFCTTLMLLPMLFFATMNLNIPWQQVTIDETVIAEEFFANYQIIDVKDEIYFVRPLDN